LCIVHPVGRDTRGLIEHLIGTLMGAVHFLPGTTFSSVAEKARSRATPQGRASPVQESHIGLVE